MIDDQVRQVRGLSCWTSSVDPEPISGGRTNANFLVQEKGEKFFVRLGQDIPVHQVMRFNELAASRAAHAAGISPEVVHTEPGALVLRFIEAKTLSADDVRHPLNLAKIVELIARCHRELPRHLRGPALVFWVFHVIRDYASALVEGNSRLRDDVPRYVRVAETLESAVGPIELVFGHNDLLPENFLDDGSRLWLVDWDYAGFNSPLFDLGGLASNNELARGEENELLEMYFDRKVDEELRKRYSAMKCASLLRESMWSMVSEIHSSLDIDYVAYTSENLARFETSLADFEQL